MAFPGIYNISYYKGDTLEFKIYPKDTSGAAFNLSQYTVPVSETTDLGYFTISNYAGPAQAGRDKVIIEGYASIEGDYVLCAITPDAAAEMTSGTTYVYDVQIKKQAQPYNLVYTLLSGSISVTEQVTEVA